MKNYILSFLVLLISFTTEATHIVGGELRLEHVQNDNYRFVLNLFFDGINGNEGANDLNLTIYIYSKQNNRFVDSAIAVRKTISSIPYELDQCRIIESLETRVIRYETEVILLNPQKYGDSMGYYALWERCCRNNSISNIRFPGEISNTFFVEFPPVRRSVTDTQGNTSSAIFRNSSPLFKNPGGDYLCLNKNFSIDFGAVDPDGDKLVYSLVTPFNGNFANVDFPKPIIRVGTYPYPPSNISWVSGFSATSAIPGNPSLRIDPNSGGLIVKPNRIGLFVFTVRCEEFREGKKIGEVRRDFQFLVTDDLTRCNPDPAPVIKQLNTSTNPGQNYTGEGILEIDLNIEECFQLRIQEDTRIQQVFIVRISENVPFREISVLKAPINTIAGQDTTVSFCWPACGSKDRNDIFEFYIIVRDAACPFGGKDSLRVKLYVNPKMDLAPITKILQTSENYNEQEQFFEARIGEPISAILQTNEPENKLISLTIKGQGIDLQTSPLFKTVFNDVATNSSNKLSFSANSSQIITRFTWEPDCSFLNQQPDNTYFIDFISEELNDSCRIDIDTFTVKIRLSDGLTNLETFLPPNTFTPNGDSKNETFRLTNLPITNIEQNPNLPLENCQYQFKNIKIFNRWGKIIFESNSRDFEWNASNFPTGVYYYFIDYKSINYKGNLSVLK